MNVKWSLHFNNEATVDLRVELERQKERDKKSFVYLPLGGVRLFLLMICFRKITVVNPDGTTIGVE